MLFQPGSVIQLVMGLMISFVTFGFYAAFHPYANHENQQLSNFGQIHTFFIMAVRILIDEYPGNLFLDYLITVLFCLPGVIIVLAVMFDKGPEAEDQDKPPACVKPMIWLSHKKDGSDSQLWRTRACSLLPPRLACVCIADATCLWCSPAL